MDESTAQGSAEAGAPVSRRRILRLAGEAAGVAAAGALAGAVAGFDSPAAATAVTNGRTILNKPCSPFACADEQRALGVCPPDPHVTAQLPARLPNVHRTLVQREAYVANALPGDLYLSPGNGDGTIGGLLAQLTVPQAYDHMGIFLDAGFSIRHCTFSKERMAKHPVGDVLGTPAPTHGFDENVVRYGWPGTLTQRVTDAWREATPSGGRVAYRDEFNASYDIEAIEFAPTWGPGGVTDLRRPLVVRPCQETAAVRRVLIAVAEAARRTNGHYRFYGYTDASIALNPAKSGPGLTVAFQDPQTGTWLNQNFNAVADPCRPNRQPADASVPLVCSSFPWYAVSLVSSGVVRGVTAQDWGQSYKIVLDTGKSAEKQCQRHLTGTTSGHVVDPATFDGLVVFDAAQRARAAAWLNTYLTDYVRAEVARQEPGLLTALGYAAIPVGLLAAIFAGAETTALLVAFGLPPALAAEIAATGNDIAKAVANQLCNALANDDCGLSGTTSTAWSAPGTGRAVGPDDTAWFWSAPAGIGPDGTIQGLYGSNVPAAIRAARLVHEYDAIWAASESYGGVTIQVRRDNGTGLQPVPGATVRFACHTFATDATGHATQMDGLPEGIYLVAAFFTDPVTGYVWNIDDNKPVDVEIRPGKPATLDIVLAPPPAALRSILVHCEIDVVDRVLIGHDNWQHDKSDLAVPIGPAGDPGNPADQTGWTRRVAISSSAPAGDASGEVVVNLAWRPDFGVEVAVVAYLKDSDVVGNDGILIERAARFIIPEDGWQEAAFDLDGGGIVPNRAWMRLHLTNSRQA
nr:hypothetical protein GCM10020063_058530 [Dactylosporangium thailandense]